MMFKIFIVTLCALMFCSVVSAQTSRVYVAKGSERQNLLSRLFAVIELPDLAGKKVAIKPNFNSNDPYPATTHPDTLEFIIKKIKEKKPVSITIFERSGMGDTDEVLEARGVKALAAKYGVRIVNLDKLPTDGWNRIQEKGLHWNFGFLVPKELVGADYVINVCCLKTHRFGGDFTLSLKNNVGSIAKWKPDAPPYNYMWELHASPSQRIMIAEINKYIPCHLVIMDGMQGFANQGPEKGLLIEPGLILASSDRVAIDAVGVSLLRSYGTTAKVSRGRVFAQDQLKHAAALNIGARSEKDIELVPLDDRAKQAVSALRF
jgi:uncharacterized protein (DUF362 family)